MRQTWPSAATVLVAVAMIVIAGLCLVDFFDSHAAGAHPPAALAVATVLPLLLASGRRLAAALVLDPLGTPPDPSTPPPRF